MQESLRAQNALPTAALNKQQPLDVGRANLLAKQNGVGGWVPRFPGVGTQGSIQSGIRSEDPPPPYPFQRRSRTWEIEKWCPKTSFFLFIRQTTELTSTFTTTMLACSRAA